MARGRMLNKKISRDMAVGELARVAGCPGALFYTWLIPHLDREGRMDGEPVLLKGAVVPWIDECTTEVIANTLAVAASLKLIEWYESGGQRYVCFPKFLDNQKGLHVDRESPSDIPPATDGTPCTHTPAVSGVTPAIDGGVPAEWKGKEGKGREENISPSAEGTEPAPSAPDTHTALAVVDGVALAPTVLTEVVRDVVRYYRQKHDGKGRQLKPGHPDWKRIEARVREGFSADDLKLAVDGNALDEWHRANPAGHTAEYVFRSATKVEGFIATARGGTGPPRRGESALRDVTEDLLTNWVTDGSNKVSSAHDTAAGLLPAAGQRR